MGSAAEVASPFLRPQMLRRLLLRPLQSPSVGLFNQNLEQVDLPAGLQEFNLSVEEVVLPA